MHNLVFYITQVVYGAIYTGYVDTTQNWTFLNYQMSETERDIPVPIFCLTQSTMNLFKIVLLILPVSEVDNQSTLVFEYYSNSHQFYVD